MKGFTNLDSVDVSGANKNSAINGWAELKESNPSRPRVSASALNKWFIAVTVIRNPTLIYNRKGFLRHILLGIPNSPSLNSRDGLQENDGNQSDEKHLSKNSKDNGEHGTELRTPTPDNLDGIISIRDNKINGNVEYTEHHF
ncbi:hypothetical protein AC249_AIPGENE10316 [Exaiptasia diaphana]|nr:hypothetical protein AC249_AIPGENE10316 [Exaiptasia diaphana]